MGSDFIFAIWVVILGSLLLLSLLLLLLHFLLLLQFGFDYLYGFDDFFFLREGLMNLGYKFRISLKNLMICIGLLLDLREDRRRKRVEEVRELDERRERKKK